MTPGRARVRRRSTVIMAALVLALCSALTVTLLRSPAPAAGPFATGAPLLGNEESWMATLAEPGRRPPGELMRDALGCVPLFQWATGARAVPRGQVTLAYSVGASPSRAALVRGIRVVKGPDVPLPRGDDVACAGQVADERLAAVTAARGKPVQPVRLSLDGLARGEAGSREEAPLPVRAGGTATGLVTVMTAACSCAWWVELDVEENGGLVTVRVDDDGRPFTLAPPTTPLATSADQELMAQRPLSRAAGDPQPPRAGISAAATLVPASESRQAESDVPLDPAAAVGGEARLGRVGCRRMYESVVRAGGVPAGDHEIQLVVTAPAGLEGAVLDARVRLATVRLDAEQRYRYACSRAGVNPHTHAARQAGTPELSPHTLMRGHPRQGVGLSVPLATDEPFSFRPTGLNGVPRPDGRGAYGTAGVIVPQVATFGLTVEVTVTLPTGERADFTLTDHGEPFLLGPATDMMTPAHREQYHEPNSGPGVHYNEELISRPHPG
ncbi:hypothetical protein OG906_34860 (plasmid) [Streptomyces sp. NBC_01426]|uniref:hypothetical protein n=1 Tax=Streptomyces sp. NBC_01426 TaxID=2975866 RepID=UPI002E309FFF|nr:hypothetical protein [Streptomyces sp. NBC_01426]